MALYDGYLDVAIGSQGMEVTIAGENKGEKDFALGRDQVFLSAYLCQEDTHMAPQDKGAISSISLLALPLVVVSSLLWTMVNAIGAKRVIQAFMI